MSTLSLHCIVSSVVFRIFILIHALLDFIEEKGIDDLYCSPLPLGDGLDLSPPVIHFYVMTS